MPYIKCSTSVPKLFFFWLSLSSLSNFLNNLSVEIVTRNPIGKQVNGIKFLCRVV